MRCIPISFGSVSSLFSSRSSRRRLENRPIVEGSFFNELLLNMSTSSFSRRPISSGRLVSWFVPKLSSTIFSHVAMSSGREDNWLSFIFSLVRCFALENIPYGMRLIRLCSILIDWEENTSFITGVPGNLHGQTHIDIAELRWTTGRIRSEHISRKG